MSESGKTERTPDEMLSYIRECWLRYRQYPRWSVIFERCQNQIIEVMSSSCTPVLATAVAIYTIGEAEGAEGTDCWLAVGWEMHLRMVARSSIVLRAATVQKVSQLSMAESRDGSVLVNQIGGNWAINQEGRLVDL